MPNNLHFSHVLFSGVITTTGLFDYELVKEYVLTLEAKDEGDPPMSDTCLVTVHILDTNDNQPTFSQSAYSASVREDAKISDSVIQVWLGIIRCFIQSTFST